MATKRKRKSSKRKSSKRKSSRGANMSKGLGAVALGLAVGAGLGYMYGSKSPSA